MTDEDDDNDSEGTGKTGVMGRPFVLGIIAGLIGFFLVLWALPPAPHAPENLTVSIEQTGASDQQTTEEPAEQTADTPRPPEADTPPPATVPIVAEAAIVIADIGLNRRVAMAVDENFPREATLAVSVYATDPAGTAAAFKASGRDVWLEIAAQSTQPGIDPGPLAVAYNLGTKSNTDLLAQQIQQAGGNIVGIFVPNDADITGDQDMWRDIATNVIGDNLMIMDSTPAKVATSLYMQRSDARISAYLKADMVLSGTSGPAALQKSLADAIPFILNRQQAIIVLNNPTILAVETLGEWVKTLGARGIRLVPASAFTGLKG